MTSVLPETLLRILRAHPRVGSAELCRLLGGVNRSTLARALRSLEGRIVSRGGSRRIRYALRRELRGSAAALPVYRIDAAGRGHELGLLDLIQPQGSALAFSEPFPWPLDDDSRDGWFDRLRYPLFDMRPQGFIGRNFARQHALDLSVSGNPDAWSDDDIVHLLSLHGHDLPGDLILGEVAYRRFLAGSAGSAAQVLAEEGVELAYPELAAAALAQGVAGSSAGGEFPKFTVRRMRQGQVVDLIVKFSGADGSPTVRRWSDLLVCEHLALVTLDRCLGIPVARSAIVRACGRTFLEVERFDRHGAAGRSPVCTLASINAALIGSAAAPWPRTAHRLQARGWLSAEDLARIDLIWSFGRLIGNTDMHEGNLAFRPGLRLAPVYDMLPMVHAPLRGGELPARAFAVEPPLPGDAATWRRAASAAVGYWRSCAEDARIRDDFRRTCAENAVKIERVLACGD